MTYTIPEAAIRAAGRALRTRTGVDFDGLVWWPAIAMLSAASRGIDQIYNGDE